MPEIRGVSLNPVRAEIGIYTTATLGAGLIRLELAQNQIRVLDTLKKSDGSGNLVAWNQPGNKALILGLHPSLEIIEWDQNKTLSPIKAIDIYESALKISGITSLRGDVFVLSFWNFAYLRFLDLSENDFSNFSDLSVPQLAISSLQIIDYTIIFADDERQIYIYHFNKNLDPQDPKEGDLIYQHQINFENTLNSKAINRIKSLLILENLAILYLGQSGSSTLHSLTKSKP